MGNVFFFEIFPRARPWRRLTARWKPFPNDLVPLFFCVSVLPSLFSKRENVDNTKR